MLNGFRVLVGTCCLAVPMCVWAEPVKQIDSGWLQTIAFAAHQTQFSGTFVYQHGNHVETSRIVHVVDENGEHEHLESLDGPRREVIRNNGQVWCVLGDHRSVRVEKGRERRAFPDLLPEQLSALNQNYLIREGARARVAGHEAQAILFQPRDGLRYAHKMWAHLDTGLLLKSVMMDDRGLAVEQYAFTEVKLSGNIDKSWIASSKIPPEIMQQKSAEPVKPGASAWRVDALPAGFKRVSEIQRAFHERKVPVIHQVYTDGLAGISVFIEPERRANEGLGLTSHGAINIFNRSIDGYRITVVGEVPARTVIQVADSVRYTGQ